MPRPLTGSGSFGSRFTMNNILTISKTLNAAQVNAMHGTPIAIVRAPGAGYVVLPVALTIIGNTTGHTPWAAGGQIFLSYDGNPYNCSADLSTLTNASNRITYALQTGLAFEDLTLLENQSIDITNDTQAFSGGAGSTASIFLVYELVKL